jgi:hypothetical protein
MARIKQTARIVDPEPEVTNIVAEGSESDDFSGVQADLDELEEVKIAMEKTYRFPASVVSGNTLRFYETKDYFPEVVARAPGDESVPSPQPGESVVFTEFFKMGLRLPLDWRIAEFLDRYQVKLHQITPAAIVQLSKWFWITKTFDTQLSVDSFCRFFELHYQKKKQRFPGCSDEFEAQYACLTFVPRKEKKRSKYGRVELSYAQRNKYDDSWVSYWFYVTIEKKGALPGVDSTYPLHCQITDLNFVTQPGFNDDSAFKKCNEAFHLAVLALSGRDVVEEFVAAKIWPLQSDWRAESFEYVKFDCHGSKLPCPRLKLERPKDKSDESIVAEVEREACDIIGPYHEKEYESAVAIVKHDGRINRVLHMMGVKVEPRAKSSRPSKRTRASGNTGSEVPPAKKAKTKEAVAPKVTKKLDSAKAAAKKAGTSVPNAP